MSLKSSALLRANHFYWLYKLYPDGTVGHAFPQFWSSTIILILYWAIFRISYVVRKIDSSRQESISTVAALVNTMMLLAVMKFQSIHPELAFCAVTAIGALEFVLGQLPVTRRRHTAFALLSVVGTLLIFAAVPFKFSGNNIALLWMIAAEALLIAGIVQRENLFRRLGLLAGCLTGLFVVYEARSIVDFRSSSEAVLLKDGVLLLTCAALFSLNALYIRAKWRELFGKFDSRLATVQSHLGCITAFLGMWALFAADWTAIAWAAMLFGVAIAKRRLKDRSLLPQAWAVACAVIIRAAAFNLHVDNSFPNHMATRILTLPLVALFFYCTSWALGDEKAPSRVLRSVLLWAETALIAALAFLELPSVWIAPVWMSMAVALCFFGRRFRLRNLTFQEYVLAAAAVVELFIVNLEVTNAVDRSLPLIGCVAALYAFSRFCTQKDAQYRQIAAWLLCCELRPRRGTGPRRLRLVALRNRGSTWAEAVPPAGVCAAGVIFPAHFLGQSRCGNAAGRIHQSAYLHGGAAHDHLFLRLVTIATAKPPARARPMVRMPFHGILRDCLVRCAPLLSAFSAIDYCRLGTRGRWAHGSSAHVRQGSLPRTDLTAYCRNHRPGSRL